MYFDQHLGALIQFTKIGIERGLPVDVIQCIVSKNVSISVVRCEFCDDWYSFLYYEKNCQHCIVKKIQCCKWCYDKVFAEVNGKDCRSCHAWLCGMCCNNVTENYRGLRGFYGQTRCICGQSLVVSRDFPHIIYTRSHDPLGLFHGRKI